MRQKGGKIVALDCLVGSRGHLLATLSVFDVGIG